MHRIQLIKNVEQAFPQLKDIPITDIVNRVFYEINHSLLRKEAVDIRTFGRFSVVKRKARVGRDASKNFAPVRIPSRYQVKFKAGKKVLERLNETDDKAVCREHNL